MYNFTIIIVTSLYIILEKEDEVQDIEIEKLGDRRDRLKNLFF